MAYNPLVGDIAEILYEFITDYRYHGPLVHDPVRPEVAKERLIWLIEYCDIEIEDARFLLKRAKENRGK